MRLSESHAILDRTDDRRGRKKMKLWVVKEGWNVRAFSFPAHHFQVTSTALKAVQGVVTNSSDG